MSHKTQSANMVKLALLLSSNLGYIYGEREIGPNGAKRDFLRTGRVFISALSKDLGLFEVEINVNKAGIAVSGEVYMTGLWDEMSGLSLWLEQDLLGENCMCYRTITVKPAIKPAFSKQKRTNRKRYEPGRNNFETVASFAQGDYEALLKKLIRMKEADYGRKAA